MASFNKVVTLLTKYSDRIAQIATVAMMLVLVLNIIGRLFSFPLYGTDDYVSFMSAILIALALPYCALNKGHIQIELIVNRFPQRAQGIIGIITNIFSLGIFAVVTWQCIVLALRMQKLGETSMTAMVPFYPFIYVVAAGTALLCLVIILELLQSISLVRGVKN
jgi:TRAP-type C4-dicarboxylate transport system permease small subunit